MPNSSKLLTAGGFLSFFAFGFIDNLKGPLLPELLRGGEYTYSQAGTLIFAAYLGFILATLATGVIADIISNRSVLLLAAICLCIGSIGIGFTRSYLGLIVFMGVTGLGLGAIELGANGLIVELHSETRGRFLNLLATCHGVGSLLVPLYAATLIDLGNTWQQIYFSSICLAIPLLVLFWPRSGRSAANESTQPLVAAESGGETHWEWRTLLRVGFSGLMKRYYVLIAAYVAVELSVAAWLMEFLQQERGMSVGTSSIYLSSFFVLLMLGRLLGAFIVEHLEYTVAIFIALAGASLCIAGGLFGPGSLVVLLPLSGFFMSIVFPTITAAVSKLHLEKTGTILGILFACGGLGGALGPWIVGLVSEAAGLKLGLASTLAFALVAMVTLLLVRTHTAAGRMLDPN